MSNDFVTYFAVGPAKFYHGVNDFLCNQINDGIGEISHRSQKFTDISSNGLAALREFFRIPDDYKILYTYSATEGMEILTRSCVDSKVCHVINGNFGNVWAKTSQKALKKVQKFTHEDGQSRVELNEIQPDAETEFLAITANETATGIAYTPEEIKQLRAAYPNLLLGVDVTSSMGAVAYDFTSADAWFFSVQKAMGLPAGLGILIVGPRVQEKAAQRQEAGADVGCHHRLGDLVKKIEGKCQTPTTPNVLNIGGLGYVCRQFKTDFGTIENLYAKTKEKAALMYDFFQNHPKFTPAVASGRSESVVVASGSEEDLVDLHKRLKTAGIEIGKGYGDKKTTQIRIGNFPVHGLADIKNLITAIGK